MKNFFSLVLCSIPESKSLNSSCKISSQQQRSSTSPHAACSLPNPHHSTSSKTVSPSLQCPLPNECQRVASEDACNTLAFDRKPDTAITNTVFKTPLASNKSMHILPRWSGRNHRGKINVHVMMESFLDISPFLYSKRVRRRTQDFKGSAGQRSSSPVQDCYRLASVIMHHGRGFGSGHYTCYCYNQDAGELLGLFNRFIYATPFLQYT